MTKGWCKAEFLAKLVASGLHNLFFFDSCDGFLQQVTLEMVQTIDLKVFSGEFRCCSVQHVGYELCDREKLCTSILDVYAHYLRTLMSTDAVTVSVVQMDHEKERMLLKFFDLVEGVNETTTTPQTRELFDPLPEILEKRIKASWTKYNAQDLQPRTGPTSDTGRSQRDFCEEEAVVASTEQPAQTAMKELTSSSTSTGTWSQSDWI